MRGSKARRQHNASWLAASAIAAISVGCVYGLTRILQPTGALQTAANLADVLAFGVAVFSLAKPAISWVRDRRAPLVATPQDVADAKEHLAMLLMEQWRNESKLRSLDDPDPIPVRWRLTDRENLVDVEDNLTTGVLTVASSDDVTALIDEFRRLRRRRLVILGDAGAGKTTLAVQILLQLLRTRESGSAEPVPVLLSLAGWDTSSNEQLHAWVAGRITHDYPDLAAAGFRPHVIEALAAAGHVLPILDGLDETPPEMQETVIEALNRSMDGDSQLVLTSRTAEFGKAVEAAQRPLASAVVVEPEPLTPAAAAAYLRRCLPATPGPVWEDILRRLGTHNGGSGPIAALADIATFPLGLWLIRVAYISPGVDPAPLLDAERFPTATAMRAHLFDRLVEACVRARPPSDNPTDVFRPRNSYDPRDVQRWLAFLAVNLDRWGTHDFDWTRDVPKLAPTTRWPHACARIVQVAAPEIEEGADRTVAGRPWGELAFTTLLLVGFVAVLAAVTVVTDLVRAVLPGTGVPDTIGVLPVALVVVAGCGSAFWIVVVRDRNKAAGAAEVDWESELRQDWYKLRAYLVSAAQPASYGVAYGLLSGLVSGVLTEVLCGTSEGPWIGLAVGGAVAVITALTFADDRKLPVGTRPRVRWYGVGPGPGVRGGVALGILLGALGGAALGGTFAGDSDQAESIVAWCMAAGVAALCALFVVVRGVLVPVLASLTSLVAAGVRLVLLRAAPVPAGDGDDSLAGWRGGGLEQRLRMVRILLLTVFVSVAADGLWLAARRTPEWSGWLASRLADFHLTWAGHLRYAVAAFVAWLVTVPRQGHRDWRRWLVWFAVFGLVVALWPSLAHHPDGFRLELTVHYRHPDLTLGVHWDARLHGNESVGEARQRIDLPGLVADEDVRLVALFMLVISGLVIAAAFIAAVEEGQPKIWWSNRVAAAWHVARGRMPGDLMAFLDDAHRLGLLRAVGTIYQFRHAELQDHLARSPVPASGPVGEPASPGGS